MTVEPTKRCSRCGEELPYRRFHRKSASPDGRSAWREPCRVDHERKVPRHELRQAPLRTDDL